MRYRRARVLLPEDLARDIDAIAGRRGRSAFLVETATEAVRRLTDNKKDFPMPDLHLYPSA